MASLLAAPPIVHDAHSLLLYDLAIVVGAAYQQVIEPTQAGKVPRRLANKIFPLLHSSRPAYYENEDTYLEMIFSIARYLGLLRLTGQAGRKSRYMPGPKLAAWSRMQPGEQTRLLAELWWNPANNFWSDLAGVNYRPDHFGYYLDVRSARKALLEYLAQECEIAVWYALQPFLQTIRERNPLLLRSHSRYSSYGNSEQTREAVLANWEQGDSEVIVGMLTSSLHEMGLVTTGYQSAPSLRAEAGNAYAFKLTELARTVLWPEQAEEEFTSVAELPRTLIVQPNFELLLLQPDFSTLYQILPFARAEQIEMVSRLTLTQESVRRGIEAGLSMEQIMQTLRECSQKDLPQNVLYTLQDWSRFYKDATVSQILLLEVSTETVADEICASPKFRALELRRLGPCAIVVSGQVSLQVLRSTLEKEGVIMRVQGDILTAREVASTSSSTYYGRRR